MKCVFKRKKLFLLVFFLTIIGGFAIKGVSKSNFLTSFNKKVSDYNLVKTGEEKIEGTDYVTFDAFFLKDIDGDGESEAYRGTKIKLGSDDKLQMELKVLGDVTLKDATLTFESSNVKVSGTLAKSSIIPSTISSTDFKNIKLGNANNGTTSFFYLNVIPYIDNDLTQYSGINKVILKGTVIDNVTNQETKIEKTIEYNVDSYSQDMNASILSATAKSDEEYSTKVIYEITTQENDGLTPVKAAYITGSISDLKGQHPTNVIVKSADGKNIDFNYDSGTQTFTAVKTSTLKDNVIDVQAYNTKTNGIRYNKWIVYVEYPHNEEELLVDESVNLSFKSWYTGYSNYNLDEIKSNVVSRIVSHEFNTLVSTTEYFNDNSTFTIGDYVSSIKSNYIDKTPIEFVYLGQNDSDFQFNEKWSINSYVKKDGSATPLYTGSTNRLGDTDIADYVTYKSLKLNTKGMVLPSNGKISIINAETDETLIVLTADNWNEEFIFPDNVHKINVKTTTIKNGENVKFAIEFVKNINSKELSKNIPITDFGSYATISNSFNASYEENLSAPLNHYNSASFTEAYSSTIISTDKTSYERDLSETSIPMKLTISHNSVDLANKVWKHGYHLIKLPKEIISVNDINITSNNRIVSYELIEKDNQNYLKIITENNSSLNYDVNIKFNAIVNPKGVTSNVLVELYSMNYETATVYRNGVLDVYDLDSDGNTDEKVNYSKSPFSLVTPQELLTGSIIKDYDEKGSTAISPLIADVNTLENGNDANVEIFLINNSQNKIKGISLIGKVAYKGNTYQIGTGSLGSEYDVQMAGPIKVPDSLKGKVTVYYSENKTPTKDINDSNNGWVENPSDYSNIKTYLIVLDDNIIMNTKDEYSFEYPIEMPNTTENLLKVTYFTHGVYFNYITDSGTYPSEVSGAKLGVRMARKYNVKINTYKKYSNQLIKDGRYLLSDSDGNTKSISINSDGEAIIEDLYVDKEYKLIQYSISNSYILDREEKTFKVQNDNDKLNLIKSGTYKNINYDDKNVLNIDLENDIMYTLDLHNVDSISDEGIKNSIFKITGKNHESGTNIVTDSNGHAYLRNMIIDEVYEVEQINATNYAVADKFNIKLVRDEETRQIKIAVERIPTIEKSQNCDTDFSFAISGTQYSLSTVKQANTKLATVKCNLSIDLTNFSDVYNLSGNVGMYDYMFSGSSSNVKLSLLKDVENVQATPFTTLTTTTNNTWSNATKAFNTTQAYEKNGNYYQQTSFVGGSKYNLYISYTRGSASSSTLYYNPYMWINSLQLASTKGKIEFVYTDETENVNPKDNYNVYQKIYNYNVDDTSNPILEVKILNKFIDKFTFEINKIDGEDEKALSGAQFKITGPGLPTAGKYVTTDKNGKAKVDLYLSYTGNTSLIAGLNSSKYPKTNVYKVEELVAPKGYSKESKAFYFKGVANIKSESDIEYSLSYDTTLSNNKFTKYEVDKENKKISSIIANYPIVKISKKDEETGEILPNTYYVINSVVRKDGIEELSPAKDADGNYVGEKIIIDDKEYYVVRTNSKGEINLNLSSGQYQLKEIQAADEKYEISDQITYFGVGETIPYQAAGADIKNIFMLDSSINNKSYYRNYPKVYQTDDGGYILTSTEMSDVPVVSKYDKNNKLIWQQSLTRRNVVDSYATYFDNPERIVQSGHSESPVNYNFHVQFNEEDDGYYFSTGFMNVFKLNKSNGNPLFDSNKVFVEKQYSNYSHICETNSSSISGIEMISGDSTHKYCAIDTRYYLNQFYGYSVPLFDSNSSGMAFMGILNGAGGYSANETDGDGTYEYEHKYYYGIELSDGTRVLNKSTKSELYMIKTDLQGNILSAVPLTEKITEARNNYIDENNIDSSLKYTFSGNDFNKDKMTLKYLEDGSTVLVGEFKETAIIRFDKNGNVISYVPMGFKGQPFSISRINNSFNYTINDDGTVYGYTTSSYTFGNPSQTSTYEMYQKNKNVDLPVEPGHPNGFYSRVILMYDKNSNLKNIVEYQRDTRLNDLTNDYKRVYNNGYSFGNDRNFYRVDDGFIVTAFVSDSFSVELASGETVTLKKPTNTAYNNYTLIVYKVNDDSSVEWIKQYDGIYSQENSYTSRNIKDNKFSLVISSQTKKLTDSFTGKELEIANMENSGNQMILTFELNDEVKPSSPEAFILELTNKRKEYKINITSNDGGTFEVKDPNNKVIYNGNEPGIVETVKHGDDTTNIIKVIPNEGYSITRITVNGQPTMYTANNDGSVVIDSIKNVTEEKNINVTFEKGASVIVHHYLNGTKIKIASDEILTGKINSEYTTIPKTTKLYSLIKDENNEYVIPKNYKGKYSTEPIEVIYYYEVNKVDLVVNYHKENTSEELAPSIVETYDLGSKYFTEALNIKYYKVSSVVGNESGTLENDVTEVTYYYDRIDKSHLKVRYVDKKTNEDLVDPIEKDLEVDAYYETEKLQTPPSGYQYSGVTDNYKGQAQFENIEVIYYYEKINNSNSNPISKDEDFENPPTLDKIHTYILFSLISIFSMFISIKWIKKLNKES